MSSTGRPTAWMDSNKERRICSRILSLLDDSSNGVQAIAVKKVGLLLTVVQEEQVIVICDRLSKEEIILNCAIFGTCNLPRHDLIELLSQGNEVIYAGNCDHLKSIVNDIEILLHMTLVQSTFYKQLLNYSVVYLMNI